MFVTDCTRSLVIYWTSSHLSFLCLKWERVAKIITTDGWLPMTVLGIAVSSVPSFLPVPQTRLRCMKIESSQRCCGSRPEVQVLQNLSISSLRYPGLLCLASSVDFLLPSVFYLQWLGYRCMKICLSLKDQWLEWHLNLDKCCFIHV